MVPWVVIDRQHVRQAAPFASLHSSSIFPLPHLSPLLPTPYGHSYTTVTQQPLCNQSVTHSFDLDGGCTPLLDVRTFKRFNMSPIYPPSFQSLAHSSTQRWPLNLFHIYHFRTLFITTGGVLPFPVLRNEFTPPAPTLSGRFAERE